MLCKQLLPLLCHFFWRLIFRPCFANSSFHSSFTSSEGSSSDHALQTAPSTPPSLLLEAHLQTMLCKQLLPLLRHFFRRLIFRPCFANSSFHSSITSSGGSSSHLALQTAPSTTPSLLLKAHLQTMLCKQLLPLLHHFFRRLIFTPCFANSSFHYSVTSSGGSSSDHALQTAPSTPPSLLQEAHLQTMLCKQLLPLLHHFF